MAYKRNIDRLPIPPRDAKVHNVVCHYCIVGCGYKSYSWPANRQGGTAPGENAFGVDLAAQQPADSPAWYSPSSRDRARRISRPATSSISSPRQWSAAPACRVVAAP